MRRLLTLSMIVGVLAVAPGAALVGKEHNRLEWQMALPADRGLRPDLPKGSESTPIKGIYCSFYALGHHGLRTRLMRMIEETELNAIVMDAKGDRGFIPFASEVPLAAEIGARDQIMVRAWEPFIRWFKQRNIYTIARIVTFKDDLLARSHPEWAVRDGVGGGLWRDREGLAWVDPFREEVWEYNIALALEAARKGFDEIQFDYVRFPSDGDLRSARFSRKNNERGRREAIAGFLKRARQTLSATGVKIAVDVFGYTVWRYDDTGIGQNIEELAPYIDVLCPMLYPSSFHAGIPGYPVAVEHPYEIVFQSVRKAVQRLDRFGVSIRPWIQDFRDYAFDRRFYTPAEIRDQMQGALDGGSTGWILWNPRVRYSREALEPSSTVVASVRPDLTVVEPD